ncbi:phosphoglycerate kinase [Salmonella enterica subsp. arizonae]|uniref:phosphoglycerate kinase n=1 Tax=Salmonella enterica subsp. arizonae TaxID=59203 RepID=A0A379T8H1_SALER|nr:phosphoglycerate kinase [Salmonella enterica subsp. arizonae]
MSVIKMTDLDLAGKRVFIRADLNVPVKEGKVTSDARYPRLPADHRTGSETGRESDGNFPLGSSYRRRVQRRILSAAGC